MKRRQKGFLTGLFAFWGVIACLTTAAVTQHQAGGAPVQETVKNYNLK